MKRVFFRWLLGLSLTLAVAPAQSSPAERPNIVFVLADDIGVETLGSYGGPYTTPALDRLAARGVRFTACHAQPVCTPSRVQLLTGQNNARNYRTFGRLERDQPTFVQLLREAGYATAIGGKWQLGREPDSPRHFGFEEALLWQHRERRPDAAGRDTRYPAPRLERDGETLARLPGQYGPDQINAFVLDFVTRHRDSPFFVFYSMLLAHAPFSPPPGTDGWNPTAIGDPDNKGDPSHFPAMMAHLDRNVGRLLERLDELDLTENTLVVFVGDNGTDPAIVTPLAGRDVRGGKGGTHDAGTHVPLIVAWPGRVAPGVSDALIDFSDFFPTLLSLAGVPVPAALPSDGHDFSPLLTGDEFTPRAFITSWYSYNGTPPGVYWARDHRYKLYDDGQFFDIYTDPEETHDRSLAPPIDATERAARAALAAALAAAPRR